VVKGKENRQVMMETSDNITQEKERLQRLAMEYARKIEDLKAAQAKKEVDAQKQKIAASKQKEYAAIPRIEKIEIGSSDVEIIDSQNEEEEPGKRRRSLLDLNSSTKPNLHSQKSEDSFCKSPVQPPDMSLEVKVTEAAERKVIIVKESLPHHKKVAGLSVAQVKRLQKIQVKFDSQVCC